MDVCYALCQLSYSLINGQGGWTRTSDLGLRMSMLVISSEILLS